MSETTLRGTIVSVSLLLITFVVFYFEQKNEITELKKTITKQTNVIDSLHDENFISFTELGRYELTLEHLKETNPKLGKEMEEWMYHETE
jgi:cell division protein FtsL